MDYINGILLGFIWIGGILVMRSITTFFHEMGHAIPALLFTKNEKVNVLVGSYGNVDNSVHINLGRLVLYLKFNVLNWRIGLCSHGPIKGFMPQLLVILGGPIASLLIASLALYFLKINNFPDYWVVFIAFFLVSAIFDFIVNLDPSHTPIKLFDNSITYSDGYQLVRTFKRRGLPNTYFEAEKLFAEKKFEATVEKCMDLLEEGRNDKVVYDLMIESCLAKKDYAAALKIYDSIKAIHPYSYIDFFQLGLLNLKIDRLDEALLYFDHCVYEKHNDPLVLANRGFIHSQKGNLKRAEQDLAAAIAYGPDNPDVWNYRGLLHLKQGKFEESYHDLQIAYKLTPDSPTVSYHLGLLFEEKRDFKQALAYFKHAKEKGLTYHGIDLKIADLEAMVDAFL